MGDIEQAGGLQIDQDLPFQEREWRVQRGVWVVLAVVLVLALVGLLGSGPLSTTTAGSVADGAHLEYHRFAHHGADMAMRFRLAPSGGDEARLWITLDYLQGLEISHITPDPDSVEAGTDRLTYVFKTSSGTAEADVVFTVRPRLVGYRTGRFGMEGRPEQEIRQVIFP